MYVSIYNTGKRGIVKDIPAYDLPPEAWSDGQNVRFKDLSAMKCNGYSLAATPSVAPYALFYCPSEGVRYWVYAGLEKIYAIAGASQAEITRASGNYAGGILDIWNGAMFHGMLVITNGVDNPQVWNPPSLSQRLVDLPNWPANTVAKVIRPFKNFLIALDVTKSGTRDSRLVKWSHTADPGTLPSSWDETDASKDAGEVTLAEGEDQLIDALQLGDANIIYTELSAWKQTLSGTSSIFNFRKAFETVGMLAQGCGVRFGKRHFVVTQDDIVVHDGTTVQSVADVAMRKWFFQNLDSSTFYLTRAVAHRDNKEIWVCFPSSGALLDMALVWNWVENTWSIRELPDIRSVTEAIYEIGATEDLWDSGADLTWDEESTKQWGMGRMSPVNSILMSPADTSGIVLVDSSYQAKGSNFRSYLERTDLAVAGMSREGQIIVDPTKVKMLIGIAPRVIADAGTELTIYVGSQDDPGGDVDWAEPVTFKVGTDTYKCVYRTGRYLAVRFEETADAAWKLQGYDLDVVPLGEL